MNPGAIPLTTSEKEIGMPFSRDTRVAISLRRALRPAANAFSRDARSAGPSAAQGPVSAPRAAATAMSMSSVSARADMPKTSPVAASTTSVVAPLTGATQAPSM